MNIKSFLAFLIVILAIPLQLHARTFLVTADLTDYPGEENDLVKFSSHSGASVEAAYRKQDPTLVCTRLVDQQVTTTNLVAAIKELFSKADTNDIVVVYIHGHGYDGGYCTYDGYLSYSQLREAMASCTSHHKMIFADCCHSGSLRSKPSGGRSEKRTARRSNVMLFLSSRNDEISWVTTKYYKGFFTAYLCKALDGEADANNDNVVTARELYLFVKKGVVKETSSQDVDIQHPVMWGNFSDNMPVIYITK